MGKNLKKTWTGRSPTKSLWRRKMLDPFLKERAFGVLLMDGPERKVS